MEAYIRLDELCDINMGQSPDSSSYNQEEDGLPFFQGNADFGELYPVTRMWCNKPTKIVEKDTLLISVRAPIGALNFAGERSCIGRGLAGIKPKEDVNIKYIFYSLKHKNAELNNKGTGSTFKAIAKAALGETQIKVISTVEQGNCVEILDRVNSVIALRQEQLLQYDNLIKSRFVEMFGDPVLNTKGWKVEYLERYMNFLTSGSRGWASYFSSEGEMFLTIKNIKDNKVKLDNIQYIKAPDTQEAKRTKVQENDLLISITADLGRTGVISKEIAEYGAYINQHLSLVRLNKSEVDSLFVSYYLESEGGRRQFINKNQSAVKAGLNFNAIKSLEIIVPPIYLQNQFAVFVQQVDKLKVKVQKSLEETQLLFASLIQRYFG